MQLEALVEKHSKQLKRGINKPLNRGTNKPPTLPSSVCQARGAFGQFITVLQKSSGLFTWGKRQSKVPSIESVQDKLRTNGYTDEEVQNFLFTIAVGCSAEYSQGTFP